MDRLCQNLELMALPLCAVQQVGGGGLPGKEQYFARGQHLANLNRRVNAVQVGHNHVADQHVRLQRLRSFHGLFSAVNSASPQKVRQWLSTRPDWLQISDAVFAPDPLLEILDRGERDAILLAESIRAERLIMDDSDGRREAEDRHLAVIGTLGVLAEAARRDLLDLSRALADLRQTNFYAAPALIEMLLANESKRRKG